MSSSSAYAFLSHYCIWLHTADHVVSIGMLKKSFPSSSTATSLPQPTLHALVAHSVSSFILVARREYGQKHVSELSQKKSAGSKKAYSVKVKGRRRKSRR